jgi:hypothetical protein
MRLSVKAMAVTTGLLWGGAVLLVGLAHLARPTYGRRFLNGISSVYPGFHGARDLRDALVGSGYAVVDGAVGGMMFAWLYDRVADKQTTA